MGIRTGFLLQSWGYDCGHWIFEEMLVSLQPFCCLGRGFPWFIRLLGLRSWLKQWVRGKRLEEIDLWDPLDIGTVVREACHGCSATELGRGGAGRGEGGGERKRGPYFK